MPNPFNSDPNISANITLSHRGVEFFSFPVYVACLINVQVVTESNAPLCEHSLLNDAISVDFVSHYASPLPTVY